MENSLPFEGWPVSIDLVDPIQIEIPLEPIGAPRVITQPFLVRGPGGVIRASVKKFPHSNYTRWRKEFARCYVEAGGPVFDEGVPLGIKVFSRFRIAETRAKRKIYRAGLHLRTMTPDFDNLLKSPTDALLRVAYQDDKQIVYCESVKFESALYDPAVLFVIGKVSLTDGEGSDTLPEKILGKGAEDGVGGSERLEVPAC